MTANTVNIMWEMPKFIIKIGGNLSSWYLLHSREMYATSSS